MRTGPRSPADSRATCGLIPRPHRAVRAVDAPVVAAVDGPAVGFGCDLALACDLRLVTERAQFGRSSCAAADAGRRRNLLAAAPDGLAARWS